MKIAYILLPNMLATSVVWPAEMWAAAQQYACLKTASLEKVETTQIAISNAPITSHGGLRLATDLILDNNEIPENTAVYDVIYLPALWRNPRSIVKKSSHLSSWLIWQYERGAILCGVGTGCCFLAETGLLDFKPATTHWYYFDRFEQAYPKVKLKRQHFITHAGSLYCAASINSLADLTIHFIQRTYGKETAQHIERHFSHEIRRSYDKNSFNNEQNMNHPDETILQAQHWMQDHLSEDITVNAMAKQFDLSERQFNRRFQIAVALTPRQYLQRIRINTAQDLLHYSNLNIGEICEQVGFNDISYFAKIFRQHRDVSPKEYRQTVRAKLFNA